MTSHAEIIRSDRHSDHGNAMKRSFRSSHCRIAYAVMGHTSNGRTTARSSCSFKSSVHDGIGDSDAEPSNGNGIFCRFSLNYLEIGGMRDGRNPSHTITSGYMFRICYDQFAPKVLNINLSVGGIIARCTCSVDVAASSSSTIGVIRPSSISNRGSYTLCGFVMFKGSESGNKI